MHFDGRMRPQKITFGEMREMGIRGVLVYCSDYRCSHSIALSADRWSGVRLSDIEPRFVWKACGQRGAEVRPDSTAAGRLWLRWGIETRHDQRLGAAFRRTDR